LGGKWVPKLVRKGEQENLLLSFGWTAGGGSRSWLEGIDLREKGRRCVPRGKPKEVSKEDRLRGCVGKNRSWKGKERHDPDGEAARNGEGLALRTESGRH